MDELVYGNFKPQTVSYFSKVVERFKDQGCDAVILGCTEIPLILNDGNSVLPTTGFDAIAGSRGVAKSHGRHYGRRGHLCLRPE